MEKEKKPRKAATKPAGVVTQDVSHEVVQANTPDQKLRVLTQDEMINLEVGKLSPADQKLNELVEKYKDVTIAGPDDKEGYRLAKEGWQQILSFRTGVEKTALAMRQDYTAINKAIINKEAQIVTRAKPHEDRLKKLFKAIDDEKERAEKEEELRLEQLLQDRLGHLTNAGMKYDDGYYIIGGTVSIDVATLRGMQEDKFAKLLAMVEETATGLKAIEEKKQEEQRQKEEQQRKDKEEARRANMEMRGTVLEALGLVQNFETHFSYGDGFTVDIADVFDVDQVGFNKTLELIKANIKKEKDAQETARIKREKEAQQREQEQINGARTFAMKQAGLELINGVFCYTDGLNADIKESANVVFAMEHAAFDDYCRRASELVGKYRTLLVEKQKKDESDAKDLKDRKNGIFKLFHDLGFRYDYNAEFFDFQNQLYASKWTMAQLIALDGDGVLATVEKEKTAIAESLTKIAALQKEQQDLAEKERLSELSDDELFKEYLLKLYNVPAPSPESYKTKTSKGRQVQFTNKLTALLKEYKPEKKGVKA